MTNPLADAEVSFSAAFDGPAVAAGRMPARDFAPSLFATAELVEASSEAVFGRKNSVTVQVQADFRHGSFRYELIATAVVVGQQVFQNLSIDDINTLLRYIGFKPGEGDNSLFGLFRRIAGRHVQRIEPQGDGRVSISVTGNSGIIVFGDVAPQVGRLLSSQKVREAVPEVVAPLKKPGIDEFRVGDGTQPSLVVRKTDLPALVPPDVSNPLADSVAVTAVELLMPNFVEGNKWRVRQGGEPFWVSIRAPEFLSEVDRGERSFAKGDFLIVELRTRVEETPEGLVAEREVLRVIEHRRRGQQLTLSVE